LFVFVVEVYDEILDLATKSALPSSDTALHLTLPHRPRAEHCALFLLYCAKWRAIATTFIRVLPSHPPYPVKHTSMPHLRTWLAFSFASGQSRGVPMALYHAPSISNSHFGQRFASKQSWSSAYSKPMSASDYSIHAMKGFMSRLL